MNVPAAEIGKSDISDVMCNAAVSWESIVSPIIQNSSAKVVLAL
jgi:hypothetical protein